MTLPQLTTPTFDLELPSTKEKVKFRPFLVKEEKVFLIAMESRDENDILNAVRTTLKNCIMTEGIDVESLPSFDIEYLFLNIRGKSVGEIIDLQVRHPDEKNSKGEECKHLEDIKININDIKVTYPEGHEKNILLSPEKNIGLVMKYPTVAVLELFKTNDNEVKQLFEMVISCIDKIWEGDNVYESTEYTRDEMSSFLESCTNKQFEQINEFFVTMPSLKHNISYICSSCKDTNSIDLEGLQDFFT
jgi:hypothetical protein